jgi:uncharacterized membrane protein YfcA
VGTLIAAGFISLGAGTLLGATGIGGVILIPALAEFDGIEVHTAVATAMFAYIFAGIVGVWSYSQTRKVGWKHSISVCVGALPGAALGAWVVPHVRAFVFKMILFTLMILAALFALFQVFSEWKQMKELDQETENLVRSSNPETTKIIRQAKEEYASEEVERSRYFRKWKPAPRISIYLFLGLVVGFASAISGSSGPVLLLPILFSLHWELGEALGCSQLFQVPVALAFTLTTIFVARSNIDWILGSVIAVPLSTGVVLGSWLGWITPVRVLKPTVAALLLLAGISLMIREVIDATE